jgi:hypothetical protein
MDPTELMTTAQFVGLVVAPLTTLVVGYVTKVEWPAKYKGAILVALSFVNGFVVELFSNPDQGFDVRTAFMRAVLAFVTAQTAYSSVVSKTDLSDTIKRLGVK